MIAPPPAALTLPLRTARPGARIPVVPPTEVRPRFTVDGGRELEQHLARTCEKIAAGIRGLIPRGKLEAVLLGGGYGRGEGGVLSTPAGERPYNDLEFYVCLRGNRHLNELRFGKALHVLGEILTPQAGVEVEFKITSLREFERGSVSMFSYDLMLGHRWLVGNEHLLAHCSHHRAAEKIPLSEATRLLMNRCSGLLFAQERLGQAEFTAANADFVRRNIAKAQLALGDAVLVAFGRYHWSVRERHRLLEQLAWTEPLPWLTDVRRFHASGVNFKLRPQRSAAPRETLLAEHATITRVAEKIWLWLEERRLRETFASAQAYAVSAISKCPETTTARNVLVNVRALGFRPLREARAGRHPRERVFHALALLLWHSPAPTGSEWLERIQRELDTDATTLPEIMAVYRDLWARVN
jgi:hypothetical protein